MRRYWFLSKPYWTGARVIPNGSKVDEAEGLDVGMGNGMASLFAWVSSIKTWPALSTPSMLAGYEGFG